MPTIPHVHFVEDVGAERDSSLSEDDDALA